jgi:anaerobic magnesium-protoporphyrin IX monomethyl ester cyclase
VVRGECEDVVADLVEQDGRPEGISSVAWFDDHGEFRSNGGPAASSFVDHAALTWPQRWIDRHHHHHHRFDGADDGPGAEVEASRGCPYHCSFCAKIDFRDAYRRRELAPLLAEIDGLIAQGVRYLYFVDEIFLPQPALLEALAERNVRFGIQTRIDLWKPPLLELLGRAGCVSIEAGVESLTEEGRDALDKKCRMTTDELADRLIHARRFVPFVQANLIATASDDAAQIVAWREKLRAANVWANDPVPLYPYPSSPDYRKLWGMPDDLAWERAHAHYLKEFRAFSDIQDQMPVPLGELEARCACR